MTSLNCSEARVEIEHRADPEHPEKSFLKTEFVTCRDGSCKLARFYIYPSDKRITIDQLETHREVKSYFQLYQTLRYVVDYMVNIDKVVKLDERETAKLVCLVSLVIGHSCMRYEVVLRESAPGASTVSRRVVAKCTSATKAFMLDLLSEGIKSEAGFA